MMLNKAQPGMAGLRVLGWKTHYKTWRSDMLGQIMPEGLPETKCIIR